MHKFFLTLLTLALLAVAPARAETTITFTSDEIFAKFSATVLATPEHRAPLQLSRADTFHWYMRTQIRNAYADSASKFFGGHYVVAEWGCGSPCQGHALMDILTGKVYSMPGSTLGIMVEPGSRVLIVNPRPDEPNFSPDPTQYVYIWSEGLHEFKLFHQEPLELPTTPCSTP